MNRDGQTFLNRCTKPDQREFLKISQAVGVGFVIMGVIGYIVKLSMSFLSRAECPFYRVSLGQTYMSAWAVLTGTTSPHTSQ